VLEQYVQVSEKYKDLIKQVKNLGNSTGQGENSKMEIQKLEAQKQFLIQQIAQFEKSISQIETQVTNLEKVTIKK
jgi:virulence-associated protein VapD